MINKNDVDLLEQLLAYLRLHNRVMYDKLLILVNKIKDYRQKENARKLKQITEKRKDNPEYAGHEKNRNKKVSDK